MASHEAPAVGLEAQSAGALYLVARQIVSRVHVMRDTVQGDDPDIDVAGARDADRLGRKPSMDAQHMVEKD